MILINLQNLTDTTPSGRVFQRNRPSRTDPAPPRAPRQGVVLGLSDLVRHDTLMAKGSSYCSSGELPQKMPNGQ